MFRFLHLNATFFQLLKAQVFVKSSALKLLVFDVSLELCQESYDPTHYKLLQKLKNRLENKDLPEI